MASNKRRKDKVVLVFDEKDRRDFITGFRKRKNERRKKANEELKKKEEEKKKQMRAEKREAARHQIEEHETKPDKDESEEVLDPNCITHDFEEHTVMVSTITDEDMWKDFVSPVAKVMNDKNVNKKSDKNNHTNSTRDKVLKKKKFQRKAQKRKIQASSDKTKSKLRKRRKAQTERGNCSKK